MKSLVDLLCDLLQDCGRVSDAPVKRDCLTVKLRSQHEGDSFITITLPNFCKDFERSLDRGRVAPGLFASFGKLKSGIPEFLQGFLRRVFGTDGFLLTRPCIDCIRSIRQICLFGKKLQRACSKDRLMKAMQSYRECDNDIVKPEVTQLYRYYKKVASILMRTLVDDSGFTTQIMPKHGPGATVERISGNQKWQFKTWNSRLTEIGFTYPLFGRACSTVHPEELAEEPVVVEPGDEKPVRVVFVPKTLKTPRVIAVEPVCMQYAQQGLLRYLVKAIEYGPLTSGHVNFTRQGINQELAKTSSGDGSLATLDMSEASDRVSLAHAEDLLESVPEFRKWVMACRSTASELPNGEVIRLKKFASMGSALCFPVESLVFFTTIIASRLSRAGVFPTDASVRAFGRSVYVYGDDLIIPADEASATCEDLESIGFKVNRSKSFWTGKFRESCGKDCYDNAEVTPVYLRRDLPASGGDVPGILSTVATSNQLFSAGYTTLALALRKAVHAVMGPLPHVPVGSPAIGWHHDLGEIKPRRRWNRDLQRLEYRCWIAHSPKVADPLEGDAALAKCFRLIGSPDSIDPEHLERSPRPHGLALKRAWVPL